MFYSASTLYSLAKKPCLEAVKELSSLGFKHAEIVFEYPHFLSKEECKQIKALDLKYSMHCPFTNLNPVALNPDIRRATKKAVLQSLEAAYSLEASPYVFHAGKPPETYLITNALDKKFFTELFLKEYSEVFQKARDYSVKMVLENLGLDSLCPNVETTRFLMQELGAGFCLDVAHAELFSKNEDWLSLQPEHLHASDNFLKKDEHLAVGEGAIDWRNWMKKLRNAGFDKTIVAECLSAEKCVKTRKELEEMFG